jgi:hypothetical protein
MDFAKISNYTIEIYFVLFYFGQRLYHRDHKKRLHLTWDATEIFENLG